ncbi:UV-endonuclease UvdE [Cucurbitaria berberidis CBS 394.84]|uniref:UV-endonuclease UvdE n=1 Tax=Cucurbitaria berberidis CBS 394.84 TaxID=1168544 RepID=A0A9P4GV94_9PLEO|nr:UV-endonuclease UvdE [Cucurbitaria berberidis CBS 394.84]KAF1852196.1 UV-endonuclease UvdE [Cucurbitaria berberidis CBS 394.84]
MMAKRKRSSVSAATATADEALATNTTKVRRTGVPLPPNMAKPARRQSTRGGTAAIATDPNLNPDILDGITALRASPDGHEYGDLESRLEPSTTSGISAASDATTEKKTPSTGTNGEVISSTARDANGAASATLASRKKAKKAGAQHVKIEVGESNIGAVNGVKENVTGPVAVVDASGDASALDAENEDEIEGKETLSRPPPVNSEYLPLPWKGRLGYACLNTYLRNANPPIFSSRTCRIASILEHRHPLKDPSQPEHAIKNRPDENQPADIARGQKYVEELGLANARDITKMVRWNDKYGIRFMRLSSEMFPFASHDEYGYKLKPFAEDTLREVGQVIAQLGHRVTTHPGQFTQLGSPRKQVIDNAIRDLEYHDEMLSLLKLPPQQNRDAVMILHLGGAYGDKPAAIARFKENYARLPQSVKNRLVLENDDVVWSVHELLPLCQELNIPFVLDFHHHNIIFDETQIREGTEDIRALFPAILETWARKDITPKMHYSESCPPAITRTARRKHSPRVMTLPPCPDTMDLMIEAKDKEQAVFELMRTFKLPGFHTFSDILPHTRQDENRPWKPKPKKAAKRGKKKTDDLEDLDAKLEEAEEDVPPPIVPEEEVAMGGPEGRVYWPSGMEEWLRPPKRIIKKKEESAATPARKKRKTAGPAGDEASLASESAAIDEIKTPAKKAAPKRAAISTKRKAPKSVPTPSASDEDDDHPSSPPLSDLGTEDEVPAGQKRAARPASTRKKSGRATARVSYKEEEADEMM